MEADDTKTRKALRNKEYRERNYEKIRARENARVAELRLSVLLIMGGACFWCGFSDLRALHIDHVHGGGQQHRREQHHFTQYRQIRNTRNFEGYQLLCGSCHAIKHYEEKEQRIGKLRLVSPVQKDPSASRDFPGNRKHRAARARSQRAKNN